MVEDKFLSEQLKQDCDEKKCVWRIVSMNHVDAVPHRDVKAHDQAAEREKRVFSYIPDDSCEPRQLALKEGLPFTGSFFEELNFGHAVDAASIDNVSPFLALSP